ncbi:MAG: hypothetical protein IKN55_11645 [Oscillospiraceae bacterium]|nr:hypothetical protein [Oscillospiraceae bacterium]
MNPFVIIACIVIVLLHAAVVCIRYRRNKLQKRGSKAGYYVVSALALLSIIVMNIPSVEERMALWIAPKMIALGAAAVPVPAGISCGDDACAHADRALVLHVPYKKFDWFQIILLNVAVAVFLIVHFIKYH